MVGFEHVSASRFTSMGSSLSPRNVVGRKDTRPVTVEYYHIASLYNKDYKHIVG